MEEKDPAYQALLEDIKKARGEGKSMGEMMKMAEEFLEKQPADYAEGRRDELLAQIRLLTGPLAGAFEGLMQAAQSGDEVEGRKQMMSFFAQTMALEPKEQREARRNNFLETMKKAEAQQKVRDAKHRKERLKRGLIEQAGTGKAEPEVIIHGLPLADLEIGDFPFDEDKPLKHLKEMTDAVESATMKRDAAALAKLPLGHSRLGGLPDLPPGQEWPKHKGKKLPFLAQVKVADFPAVQKVLPKDGHLFVFGLVSNDKKHWPTPVKVLLYRGKVEGLVRAGRPKDKEIWEDWGGERVYELLPATAKPKGRSARKRSNKIGDTLGWMFGEMDDYFGKAGEIADERMEDGDDWINLLALMSEGSMQWSDAGHFYFLIRRSALKKLDFSEVIGAVCSS